MRRLILILLALFFVFQAYASESDVCLAVYEKNFLTNFDSVHEKIKNSPIDCIAMPIAWQDVESQKGIFDFSFYDPIVENIISKGYKVSILLDAGGRGYPLDNGYTDNTGNKVHPDWVEQDKSLYSKDFMGGISRQLSFHSEKAKQYIKEFITRTVEHYTKYPNDKLIAFAPTIQSEFEIKYGQTEYKWRDFSEGALRDFKKQTGMKEPYVMEYTRTALDQNKSRKGFNAYMDFRENTLRDFICDLAEPIRKNGYKVLGYFGEVFAAHDGIYSTGVAGDLAGCVDDAVIDYNFFNGYAQTFKIYKPALMVNYMKNLGYKSAIAGLYVERWNRYQNRFTGVEPAMGGVVALVLDVIKRDGFYQGFEIGGMMQGLKNNFGIVISPLTGYVLNSAEVKHKEKKIALAVSQANFNFFIGDNNCGFNEAEESVLRTYQTLTQSTKYEVDVFSEKTLKYNKDFLKGFDLVVVPYQAVMHSVLTEEIMRYYKKGGKVLIFAGSGVRDEDGFRVKKSMQRAFGVTGITVMPKAAIGMADGSVGWITKDECTRTGIYSMTYESANMADEINKYILFLKPDAAVMGANPAMISNDGTYAADDLFLRTVDQMME